MKQRMSVRFKSHCSIEGIHNQRIVIAVSDLESDNSTVIKIKNSTQVHFVNLYANVILEFCHVSKPFLVRSVSMKIPVQVILCDMCRIIAVFCATLRFPLDRRLDTFLPADTKNPFIIDINVMATFQFIPYPAISHIRMLFMDTPDLFRYLLISLFTVT